MKIARIGGVVGLNYHVDYLVDKLTIDGATMPDDMKDASMLPNLIAELRGRGYDDESLRKIGYRNWIRILRQTWGY